MKLLKFVVLFGEDFLVFLFMKGSRGIFFLMIVSVVKNLFEMVVFIFEVIVLFYYVLFILEVFFKFKVCVNFILVKVDV